MLNQLTHTSQARFILAFFISALFLIGCRNTETPRHVPHQIYVTKVIDGDSLMIRNQQNETVEVRLFGIDAPELNQPYGKEAKKALHDLAYKSKFVMRVLDIDKYKRAVVILTGAEKNNLNKTMLADGHAWVYQRYQNDPDWLKLEKAARQNKKGLWQLPRPVAPWEWRKRSR